MKDKELAKRLIEEAVEKHSLDYEGLYNAKDKKQLVNYRLTKDQSAFSSYTISKRFVLQISCRSAIIRGY